MKARFFLRGNKVGVYVTVNGVKQRYSTGYECEPKNWIKGFPKKEQTILVGKLNALATAIQLHTSSINVTPQSIKQVISEALGKTQVQNDEVRALIDVYLLERKDEVVKVTFNKMELHLNEFKQVAGKRTTKELTREFFSMYKNTLKKKGGKPSTLNSYIKNVQAFINWLTKNEYLNRKVTLERFEARDKDIIAISQTELEVLTSSTGLIERLERVRDLFLFGCYTGLRFSDLQGVHVDMISNGMLTICQQKTGQIVQIPLVNEAQAILYKYNYQLPKISNKNANKYIKELFSLLKLNRKVYVDKVLVSLDEVISFHVARKSFITIALSKGMHAKVVQSISGHKKDEVFNKYIAFSTDTLTAEMQKLSPTGLRVVKAG